MGYYSEIVIAVRKEILAEDLIHPVIPKELRELSYQVIGDALYWHIPNWKWYDSYPEIREIETFFAMLNERELIDEGADEDGTDTRPWFGALRLGEDSNDTQTWGKPSEFEICEHRYIDFPKLP